MAASQVKSAELHRARDSRRLGSRPARVEGSTTPRPRCILHRARQALAQAAEHSGRRWNFTAPRTRSAGLHQGLSHAPREPGSRAPTPVPTEGAPDGSSAGRRAASCAHEGLQLEEAEGVPQGSAG